MRGLKNNCVYRWLKSMALGVKIILRTNENKVRLIILSIGAALMARVELVGNVNPVLIGYLSCFCLDSSFLVLCIAAVIGLISVSNSLQIAPYMTAVAIMLLLHFAGRRRLSGRRIKVLIGGLAMLSGALLYADSFYMVILAVAESALSVLFCYIFLNGLRVLEGGSREYIGHEEAIGLMLLGLGVVCGCGEVRIFGISLLSFFTALLVYICCERGGAALGMGFAAVEAVVLYFAGLYPIEIIPTVTVGGVLAFVGGRANRLLVPVGYMLGVIPMAVYFNLDITDVGCIVGMVLAGVINRLLPERLYVGYSDRLDTGLSQAEGYVDKLKSLMIHRLSSLATTFERLSQAYSSSIMLDERDESEIISGLCTSIDKDICSLCPMLSCCCGGNAEERSGIIACIVTRWIESRSTSRELVGSNFADCCGRVSMMADNAAASVELLGTEDRWRERLEHTRELVASQLSTVSRVIAQVQREVMQELNVDKELSDRLYKLTSQFGVRSVVACRANMALSVYITADSSCKTERLLDEIYNVYSLRMNIVDEGENGGVCHIQLMEKPPIRISAYCEGAARTGSSVSGDSFTYMDMGVRRYLLALADGMGSGEGARAESTASIELYEDFMEAGFDRETSVDIINSVLLMGEQRECYSTLDICTVDMYTGRAEFVKIGAVSSYLVRGNTVERIGKGTLPVGVLSEVDSFVCERRLEKGDKLVMLTDGVLSSSGLVMREDWLINVILKNKTKAPKAIAHSIMEMARENCKGTITDDMTVLVAGVH